VKEVEYRMDDVVEFEMDVYNCTIAAILTGNCTPMALVYCLKRCVFVFHMQIFVAYFFSKDFLWGHFK